MTGSCGGAEDGLAAVARARRPSSAFAQSGRAWRLPCPRAPQGNGRKRRPGLRGVAPPAQRPRWVAARSPRGSSSSSWARARLPSIEFTPAQPTLRARRRLSHPPPPGGSHRRQEEATKRGGIAAVLEAFIAAYTAIPEEDYQELIQHIVAGGALGLTLVLPRASRSSFSPARAVTGRP